MAFCSNCGAELAVGARHCSECGTVVGAAPQPAAAPAPAKKPMSGCAIAVLVVVGLMVLGAIFGGKGTPTTGGNTTGAAVATEPTLKTTAREMFAQYENNEVAAQRYYDDHSIQITGTVKDVGLDFMKNPTVSLVVPNQFERVGLTFDSTATDALASYSKGRQITATCAKVIRIIGTPMLSDCKL